MANNPLFNQIPGPQEPLTDSNSLTTVRWYTFIQSIVQAAITGIVQIIAGGTGATNAPDARTNLGLAIGTDVEAHSANLDGLSSLSGTGGVYSTAANTYTTRTLIQGAGITITNGNGVAGNPTIAFTPSGISSALTEVNDTNVTMTLGGSPTTALLNATSMTLGWAGQLSLTRGGTAASLVASNGGLVYSTASVLAVLSGTATAGKVLQSGLNSAPSWSTPTYPSASGTAGKILKSDGTNNVYTTSTFSDTYTASNILYSNGANTVTGLATANNGVLVTSLAGVPSISSTILNANLPTQSGYTSAWDNGSLGLNVGQMGYFDINNKGIVTLAGAIATTVYPNNVIPNGIDAVPANAGGTGQSSYAQGDILYSFSANTLTALPKSTASTRYLSNQGTNNGPKWDQIGLTTGVTGSLPVANGGTGDTSLTAYAVLCGGTTSTGVVQSVAALGSSGNVLTSNGAGALPTFQAAASGVTAYVSTVDRVFTSNGTYTPTAKMSYCIVQAWAGGGGGGGTATKGASAGAAGGGASGSYAYAVLTAAAIGASKAVTIGAGGAGGAAGLTGTTGGDTSLGSLVITKGGGGGIGDSTNSVYFAVYGGSGVASTAGDVLGTGATGGNGFWVSTVVTIGGIGGSSSIGGGGTGAITASGGNVAGGNASGYAAGGGGASQSNFTGAAGGNGTGGIITITEFITN